MRIRIESSTISGSIRAPRSKSHAIRLVFSSLISPVEIEDLPHSEDVAASIRAVEALGVRVRGSRFEMDGIPSIRVERIYVGGSATTLRMLIPIVSVIGGRIYIEGDQTLRRRPLDAIVEAIRGRGVHITSTRVPVLVEGKLDGNWIEIRGSESSQYISGYMVAFCLKGGGEIFLEPPIVSKSYIYLTQEVLREFGCYVEVKGDRVTISGVDTHRGVIRKRVEGDYALSSFYAVSALVAGGSLEILDLPPPKGYFGDHSIVEIYREMGAHSIYTEGRWEVRSTDSYRAIHVDIEDTPDLGPSIAPLAAVSRGVTRIYGAERLRIKESDRVAAIVNVLGRFGVEARYSGGAIEIEGRPSRVIGPAVVECGGDHRVAMMAASLALRAGGAIDGAQCVNKSNPGFWRDLVSIGGRLGIEG